MFTHEIDIILYSVTEIDGQENVVDEITWQLTTQKENKTVSNKYTTQLTPTVDSNFKQITQASKQDFIEWISNEVDVDQLKLDNENTITEGEIIVLDGPEVPPGNQ